MITYKTRVPIESIVEELDRVERLKPVDSNTVNEDLFGAHRDLYCADLSSEDSPKDSQRKKQLAFTRDLLESATTVTALELAQVYRLNGPILVPEVVLWDKFTYNKNHSRWVIDNVEGSYYTIYPFPPTNDFLSRGLKVYKDTQPGPTMHYLTSGFHHRDLVTAVARMQFWKAHVNWSGFRFGWGDEMHDIYDYVRPREMQREDGLWEVDYELDTRFKPAEMFSEILVLSAMEGLSWRLFGYNLPKVPKDNHSGKRDPDVFKYPSYTKALVEKGLEELIKSIIENFPSRIDLHNIGREGMDRLIHSSKIMVSTSPRKLVKWPYVRNHSLFTFVGRKLGEIVHENLRDEEDIQRLGETLFTKRKPYSEILKTLIEKAQK